jgi:hypothetical protein
MTPPSTCSPPSCCTRPTPSARCPPRWTSFAERGLLHGDAAIAARRDHNTELGGFLEAARAHGWAVTHTCQRARAARRPCHRRGLRHPGRDHRRRRPQAAGRRGPDGMLLGLHGAMVHGHRDDGEGELLRRLRAAIGPRVPIAITLDPHANVTRQMWTWPTSWCRSRPTRTPTCAWPRATRPTSCSARCAARSARTLRVGRPLLEEANGGRTDTGPMVERIALARATRRCPTSLPSA